MLSAPGLEPAALKAVESFGPPWCFRGSGSSETIIRVIRVLVPSRDGEQLVQQRENDQDHLFRRGKGRVPRRESVETLHNHQGELQVLILRDQGYKRKRNSDGPAREPATLKVYAFGRQGLTDRLTRS